MSEQDQHASPQPPPPLATSARPKRTRRRWIKRTAIMLVALIVVLGVLAVCAPTLLSAGLAKAYLEAQLRKSIADPLSIKSVSVTWSGPQVIKGLRIDLPDSGGNASTVDIEIDNSLSELWSMDEADIATTVRGELVARIDEQGEMHFISMHPSAEDAPQPFVFPTLSIDADLQGIRLVVLDQRSQREHIVGLDEGSVNITRNGSLEFSGDGSALVFGASGGIRLKGNMRNFVNRDGVFDWFNAQLTAEFNSMNLSLPAINGVVESGMLTLLARSQRLGHGTGVSIQGGFDSGSLRGNVQIPGISDFTDSFTQFVAALDGTLWLTGMSSERLVDLVSQVRGEAPSANTGKAITTALGQQFNLALHKTDGVLAVVIPSEDPVPIMIPPIPGAANVRPPTAAKLEYRVDSNALATPLSGLPSGQVSIRDLKTAALDHLLGLDTFVSSAIGPRVRGDIAINNFSLEHGSAQIALVTSFADVTGTVRGAVQRLRITREEPLTASLRLTDSLRRELLAPLHPLLADVRQVDQPIRLTVNEATFDPKRGVQSLDASLRLDIGDLALDSGASLLRMLALFDEHEGAQQIDGSIDPIDIRISGGVITHDAFTVRIGKYALVYNGSIDLNSGMIDMRTTLPGAALARTFHELEGFAEQLEIPFVIRGPVAAPTIAIDPQFDLAAAAIQAGVRKAVDDDIRQVVDPLLELMRRLFGSG